jgi:hypothetical protein
MAGLYLVGEGMSSTPDRELPRDCWIKSTCGCAPIIISYRPAILHAWSTDNLNGDPYPVGVVEEIGLKTNGVPTIHSVPVQSIGLAKPERERYTI